MPTCARPTVPCGSCPWRRSNAGAAGAQIPGFDLAMMRGLANTVGPGDEWRPIMACHASDEGAEWPCVGYLHVEGYSNLAVRMAAIKGTVDLPAVWKACDRLDLFGSFHEMLEEYEVGADG